MRLSHFISAVAANVLFATAVTIKVGLVMGWRYAVLPALAFLICKGIILAYVPNDSQVFTYGLETNGGNLYRIFLAKLFLLPWVYGLGVFFLELAFRWALAG